MKTAGQQPNNGNHEHEFQVKVKRFFSVCKRGPGIGRLPKEGARSLALEPSKEKPEELLSGMQQ